jgi:hypothetical protein
MNETRSTALLMETPLNNFSRTGVRIALCILLALAGRFAPRAAAQAMPTASKTMDISAFAGFDYSNPEYGPDKNTGFTFGANVTRYYNLPVELSIEVRANLTNGTDVSERTYLIGLRAQGNVLHSLHPYGDILFGIGDIHFNLSDGSTYIGDNSTVFNYGGGVNIDAYRQFQLKLDIQRQSWSLGHGSGNTFSPYIAMVGVTYRFHFRDYNRQGDPK